MIKQPWGLARLPAMTTQPPSAPAEHLAVVHALRVFSESAEHAVDEAGRRTWDTGPIIGLARTAASRTVRSIRRRPDVREVEPV